MTAQKLVGAWVPGLPHILKKDLNKHYLSLSSACHVVGQSLKDQGVRRILYYSTQWLSVLGQSVQCRANPKGVHVDENWYDGMDLPYNLKVDQPLGAALTKELQGQGFQARAVDYAGFPIDTGTIVAETLINKSLIPVSILSSCVYSDYVETKKLGAVAKDVLSKLDGPSAIVVVSGLSGRFFTQEIDLREDSISDPKDDVLNKSVLEEMTSGNWKMLSSDLGGYCKNTKADMGMKALAFLEGAGLAGPGIKMDLKSYGAIYGTGAAVLTSKM